VAPPPGVGSARVRRDSALSDEEDVFHDDGKPTSPPVVHSPPKPKEETVLVSQCFIYLCICICILIWFYLISFLRETRQISVYVRKGNFFHTRCKVYQFAQFVNLSYYQAVIV